MAINNKNGNGGAYDNNGDEDDDDKEFKRKQSLALKPERIKLLNDIGFNWGAPQKNIPWDVHYKELLEFHKEYGHTNVPYMWNVNRPLFHWVKRMRNIYKDLMDGKTSICLTPQRIELLQNLGFEWRVGTVPGSSERTRKSNMRKRSASSPASTRATLKLC